VEEEINVKALKAGEEAGVIPVSSPAFCWVNKGCGI
jgi:hypothetical protein